MATGAVGSRRHPLRETKWDKHGTESCREPFSFGVIVVFQSVKKFLLKTFIFTYLQQHTNRKKMTRQIQKSFPLRQPRKKA
jgi:hypothetical protein